MAKLELAAAAMVGALIGVVPTLATASPDAPRSVVLHVRDYARVNAGELAFAQKEAARIYERAGVRLRWTDGSARLAPVDGNLHLDVLILNGSGMERKLPEPTVFGAAGRATGRAYICYPRIVDHIRRRGGNQSILLGFVLAHEIGHLILPENSHSMSGLMRATWEGRMVAVPDFLPAQAKAVRTIVTALSEPVD